MSKIECVHCGICCRLGVCEYGKEGVNGSCIYIVEKDKKCFCKIMIEQNLTPEKMKMGGGCTLQHVPEAYEHYKWMFNLV